MDRVAVSVEPIRCYPGKDLTIIDAGTAITYEVLSQTGDYLGGNISPGIS
jgi:type III pantothenate kinase